MNRFVSRLRPMPGICFAAIALLGTGSLLGWLASSSVEAKPADSAMVAKSKEITELAAHLKKVGAKMYGAYWCPHCKHQKELFGDSAMRLITYIECDPRGENAKPDQCKAAQIKGYPTWEIKGKQYEGTQSLAELAKASGYKGKGKF